MNFLLELVERLKTKSPAWFVRIQWVTGILSGLLGILQILIGAGQLPSLDEWMPTITNVIVALATAFGVSMTAKKDPSVTLMDGPGGKIPNPGNPKPPGGS
jgi:hypothetical protein